MTNFDDFQAEHEAAKQAAAAAAQAAAEQAEAAASAAYAAKAAVERKARANATFELRQRLAAAVKQEQPEWLVELDPDAFSFKVAGYELSSLLAFERQYDKVGYRREVPNNKVAVVVGNYGSRQRYPQRKDGTHAYDKMASHLVGHVQAKMREMQTARKQAANAGVAARLQEEFKLTKYGVVQPSAVEGLPVNLSLDRLYGRVRNMTEEQARTFLQALAAAGFPLN